MAAAPCRPCAMPRSPATTPPQAALPSAEDSGRERCNSFPPRRLSFDKFSSALEAVAALHAPEGLAVQCPPSHDQSHVTGPRAPAPCESSQRPPQAHGVGSAERRAARELTRSESFPVRRSSFDRIIDQLNGGGDAGEPALGPNSTNTNTCVLFFFDPCWRCPDVI